MPTKKRTEKKVTRTKGNYSVYVIALHKDVLNHTRFIRRNPDYIDGKACFYVGQTSKIPEERLEIHKRGGRLANKYVEKYGKCLRSRKYEKYNPITTQVISILVEEWLAKKLQKEGYAVWWN